MKFARYRMALVLAALVGLGISSGMSNGTPTSAECTVTVQPGESIQAAIDGAAEGDVICLAEGTWEENVKIEKSLTLQSMRQGKTIIKEKKEGYPVIWITTPEEVAQTVSVKIEGLKVTGARGGCADQGKGICADGMLIQGLVRVEVVNIIVTENQEGIVLWNSSRVTILNTTIIDNLANGIVLHDSSQAEITASTLLENQGNGVLLDRSAQADITNSIILQNRNGISINGSAHIELFENQITTNRGWGVTISSSCNLDALSNFSGSITGSENIIHSNQIGAVCPGELEFLLIQRGAQITLELQIPEHLTFPPDELSAIGDRTIQVLKHRLTEYGLARVIVTRLGWHKILVQLINATDLDESVESLVGWSGLVEFKKVVRMGRSPEDELSPSDLSEEVLRGREGVPYVVEIEPLLTGAALLGAQAILDLSGKPLLILTFLNEGARLLSEVVQDLGAGSIIAFVLDKVIQSVVTITPQLVDVAIEDWHNLKMMAIPLNGYTWQQANAIVIIINSGTFPLDVQVSDIRVYSESYPLVGLDRPGCTVTVLPRESIQVAVDQAAEGNVICLISGTWEESLRIAKSLTLRGLGQGVQIIGRQGAQFAILITGEEETDVHIERLTVANSGTGIIVVGQARAMIHDVQLYDNLLDGLVVRDLAQVGLMNSAISNNDTGIKVLRSARVTLENSQIFGNTGVGLFVGDSTVSVENFRISDNGEAGLQMGRSEMSITNSQIAGNGSYGIMMLDSSTRIEGSTIEGNGRDLGDGILMEGDSRATIIDSIIQNNAGWGVAAFLNQCGYGRNSFFGRVIFQGDNTIDSNNTSGKLDGMGNPGNHPWNRPEVPDGQVCLP